MANDNETVAELHEWAHRESNRLYSYNYNRAPEMQEWWEDADIDYFADRALAAHKRELTEKDAEIAKLRSLVKESIELLKKVNEVEFVDVTAWFDGCVDAEQQEWLDSAIDAIHKCQLAFDGIIAKAREVCK